MTEECAASVMEGMEFMDAVAMAEVVRKGVASPSQLVESSIARIEKLNPVLNAVIHPLFEKARAQAASADLPDGPFRGVPIVLKDVLAQSAGDPYHMGMSFLRNRHWVAKEDAAIVRKLRAAGFIIIGRTNTPELAACVTTEPAAYGATRNPWNLDRSPGGSSGGSAAAVASGMVPMAHGNDMGGSIRMPAASCGLVGLKPSRGRISLGPEFGDYWGSLAHDGVLARSVRDCAAFLDVTSGAMPGDPYTAPPPLRAFAAEVGQPPGRLRCGLLMEPAAIPGGLSDDCLAAVTRTGELLGSLGHSIELDAPHALQEVGPPSSDTLGLYVARDLDRCSQITGDPIGPGDVEPWTWYLAELGRGISGTDYLARLEQRQSLARRLCAWWAQGFDLLISPTTAQPAPRLGEDPERLMNIYGHYTIMWNVTGQPAISLPLHRTADGLPVGVQLVAAYGREDILLAVAAQIEEAVGGLFPTFPTISEEAIRTAVAMKPKGTPS